MVGALVGQGQNGEGKVCGRDTGPVSGPGSLLLCRASGAAPGWHERDQCGLRAMSERR